MNGIPPADDEHAAEWAAYLRAMPAGELVWLLRRAGSEAHVRMSDPVIVAKVKRGTAQLGEHLFAALLKRVGVA